MSAFLVNDKHLSFILTWAIDNDLLGDLTPQEWFKEIYKENLKSLKYLYGDKYREIQYWKPSESKRYKPVKNAIVRTKSKHQVEVAIATEIFVECWEYQSEEHPDRNQKVSLLMQSIKDKAQSIYQEANLDTIKGVQNIAIWEYDRNDWKIFMTKIKRNR